MPSSPLVSVILPTYNRAHTLKRAVDSVILQKDTLWELIVIDDGSDDGTYEVLGPYLKNKRIKILKQPNLGVSTARNNGVKASQGRYIAFLDSDDQWLDGKLAAQIKYFSNSDLLIQQTQEIWIRKGIRVNPPLRLLKREGDIFDLSLERCMITPSSVCMHRSLLDEFNGFDQNLRVCEDYELWLRITSKYPVGLIPKNYLIRYGGHSDQLSAIFTALDKYRIQAIVGLLDRFNLNPVQKQSCLGILKKKIKIFESGCVKRNKKEDLGWCHYIQAKYLNFSFHEYE